MVADTPPPNGSFNDGKTAARHEVRVVLGPAGLEIHDQAGALLAAWPYDRLRPVDEVKDLSRLRISCDGEEGARLVIHDGALRRDLVVRAPALQPRRRREGWRWLAYGGLGLVGMGLVIWLVIPTLAVAVSRAVPQSWEEALGDQVYGQVAHIFARMDGEKTVRFCDDPAGLAALDRMVSRLAVAADSTYHFQVQVLDVDMINAVALPGGRIILFKGLLEAAPSPDMIAGIVAHEMGHVIERHGTAGLAHALGLGFFFGVVLGDIGSGALVAGGEAVARQSYGRDAEREADRIALDLLARAGISAQGLGDFFAMIEGRSADESPKGDGSENAAEEGSDPESWADQFNLEAYLSSHPSNRERHATIQADIAQRPGVGLTAALSPRDWQALKAICD